MKKLTGSFTAIGDDGKEYKVLIYTNIIKAGSFEDPKATVEGIKSMVTSNGMTINRLKKGEYQIVQTNVILRSASHDAP
jgi:hypothetical protein